MSTSTQENFHFYHVTLCTITGRTFNLIYLFVSRHEVHSMNTHTLQNAG